MKKNLFLFPMKKTERIIGWVYLPVHMFALLFLVAQLTGRVLPSFGIQLSSPETNLLYYVISFVFLLIFEFRFLRASFHDLCDNIWRTLKAVVLGFILTKLLDIVLAYVLAKLLGGFSNPNSQTVSGAVSLNAGVMTAVIVLLGPVVEEILFRGVVFGTIRKSSRIAAYIVSFLLFSVYHLWQYMLTGFDWTLLMGLLQYLPASLMLAWCYEESRSIWGPIFLHMLLNLLTLQLQLNL